MEISLIKLSDQRFSLAYDSDWEKAMKIKEGEILSYQVIKRRSGPHHRKFFALMRMIFDNQERFSSIDTMREELIIEAGFYETYIDFFGRKKKKALSMSFDNMDQFKFQELYDRVKDVICIHFRFTDESIENHIHQYY